MLNFEYRTGDATIPAADNVIIAHIVNDYGGFGRGFVVPLMKEYPGIRASYKSWHNSGRDESDVPFELGRSQLVHFAEWGNITIANMCAQHGDSTPTYRAVDYEALENAFAEVVVHAYYTEATIQMPRIGCGLGGGTWDEVETALRNCDFIQGSSIDVIVLDYDANSK